MVSFSAIRSIITFRICGRVPRSNLSNVLARAMRRTTSPRQPIKPPTIHRHMRQHLHAHILPIHDKQVSHRSRFQPLEQRLDQPQTPTAHYTPREEALVGR